MGIHPSKQTRALKERRIASVSLRVSPCLGPRPRPSLCGVPSEHTYSLGCNSQGLHPGLVCVAPLGQMARWRFRFRVRAPHRGIAFQRVGALPLDPIDHHVPNPMPSPGFEPHALNGHRIPAQGANPGDPPGKRNTRSEGTPHSLHVSAIDPALPMRCFFRTSL